MTVEGGVGSDTLRVGAQAYFAHSPIETWYEVSEEESFYQFEETAHNGERPAQVLATFTDFDPAVDSLSLPLDVGTEEAPALLEEFEIAPAQSGTFTDVVLTYKASDTGVEQSYTVRLFGVNDLSPDDLVFA